MHFTQYRGPDTMYQQIYKVSGPPTIQKVVHNERWSSLLEASLSKTN